MRKGILFVVSGPSGAGKGTVMKEVFKSLSDLAFSVSVTTRAPREGEIDGKNYYFITDEKFDGMIKNGEMLEYISKYENRYGTPKFAVENQLKEGKDVILEIETIGAENVKRLMPECVSIFIMPPSFDELWKRLRERNSESEFNAHIRFDLAREETECAEDYDYVVVNEQVSECAEKIVDIIVAERCKTSRNGDMIKRILKK